MKNLDPVFVLRYELYIDCDLYFTIRVFGWKLPDTHHLQIIFSKFQKHNNFMFLT